MLLARCLDKRDQGHEAFVADYTQAFLNAEVREGEQLYAQPPGGWNPKILTDGRRVVWRVRNAMLGLRTSPRRWQEHLSGKLKEHAFVQDERDPCLFVNTELDICIDVHVDDMLAVGPSELTKNLLQELSRDMTMRWRVVTDKPQEFLGRSLCRTPQGYTFGVSSDYVTKLCKDFGVVVEKILSLDSISSARVRRVIYYLTSGKMKGKRKCWKIKMKKRKKVKLMKRSRESERTLNSCMRHGDDHGME